MNSHTITAIAVVHMTQGNDVMIIGALGNALPGAAMMDFCGSFAQIQPAANDTAERGNAGKVEFVCFLHAVPPAEKADTQRQGVLCVLDISV